MKKFLLLNDGIRVDSNWLRENDRESFEWILDTIEGEDKKEGFESGSWLVDVYFSEGETHNSLEVNYSTGGNKKDLNAQPFWATDNFPCIYQWMQDFSEAKAYTRKKLLDIAEDHIEEEMNRKGYIDDSDKIDRFLDNLVTELLEPLYSEESYLELKDDADILLEEIRWKIMKVDYKEVGESDVAADYEGYYYPTSLHFEDLDQFKKHFELD